MVQLFYKDGMGWEQMGHKQFTKTPEFHQNAALDALPQAESCPQFLTWAVRVEHHTCMPLYIIYTSTLHTLLLSQSSLQFALLPETPPKTSSQQSPHCNTKPMYPAQGTSMKTPMYAPNCCCSCSCAGLTPIFLIALHPNIHGLCHNMQEHERN